MAEPHDTTIRLALNGLDDDIRHLSHLFDLMVEEIIEVDRSKLDNAAIDRLDRATAAAWIAARLRCKDEGRRREGDLSITAAPSGAASSLRIVR